MWFQKRPSGQASFTFFDLITVTLALSSTVSSVAAYDLIQSHYKYGADLAKRLTGEARINFDSNPVPIPVSFQVERRQLGDNDDDSSSSSSSVASTKSSEPTSGSSASSSAKVTATGSSSDDDDNPSSTSSTPTPTETAGPLPTPFDTSIGNNFTTASCPSYFQSFLSNATFRACAPMSLLLQNSLSFFQAVRSRPTLVSTLDNSCAADFDSCSQLMLSVASSLISNDNCGDDYRNQNPIVVQAHAGLIAYAPMYQASCLKTQSETGYCMVDAFSNVHNNTDRPADSYPYYTIIGIDLPTASTPTCSDCLKETMDIFAQYATVKGQPLSATYMGTARRLNSVCGAGFANEAVQVAAQASISAAAPPAQYPRRIGLIYTLVAGVITTFLLF